jgi:hypothetical protein
VLVVAPRFAPAAGEEVYVEASVRGPTAAEAAAARRGEAWPWREEKARKGGRAQGTHVELLGDGVLLAPRRGDGDARLRPLPQPRERVVRRQPRVPVERQVTSLRTTAHGDDQTRAQQNHGGGGDRSMRASGRTGELKVVVPWSAGRRGRRGCSAAARCRWPRTSRSAGRRRSSGPARTSGQPSGPTPPPRRRGRSTASGGSPPRRGERAPPAPATPCPRPSPPSPPAPARFPALRSSSGGQTRAEGATGLCVEAFASLALASLSGTCVACKAGLASGVGARARVLFLGRFNFAFPFRPRGSWPLVGAPHPPRVGSRPSCHGRSQGEVGADAAASRRGGRCACRRGGQPPGDLVRAANRNDPTAAHHYLRSISDQDHHDLVIANLSC